MPRNLLSSLLLFVVLIIPFGMFGRGGMIRRMKRSGNLPAEILVQIAANQNDEVKPGNYEPMVVGGSAGAEGGIIVSSGPQLDSASANDCPMPPAD